MISKCSENRWGCAHEIMASNDTILLLWRIFKMKWRIYEFLTKNSKMPKKQKLSKCAQNWWVWPSRVLSNMFWSRSQNMKSWCVFSHFPCQALPFSLLELFLVFFFVVWYSSFGEEVMAPCLGEADNTCFGECPSWSMFFICLPSSGCCCVSSLGCPCSSLSWPCSSFSCC